MKNRMSICHPIEKYYAKNLCKACYLQRYMSKEKITEKGKTYYQRNKTKIKTNVYKYRLVMSAKHRANKRGLPFDLTTKDIRIPALCPVLGIPLIQGGRTGNSPSLDRIDNTKGYTKDNIVMVSLRVNRLKNDATLEELRKIADFYRRYNT